MKMLKIGLLGCGNLGNIILDMIEEGEINAKVVAVLDKNAKRRDRLVSRSRDTPRIALNIRELAEGVDLVIEVASQEAVKAYAVDILSEGVDLMVLSVGALLDGALYQRIKDVAKARKSRLIIPPGAVGATDVLKSIVRVDVEKILLETSKPPTNLGLEDVKSRTCIFSGDVFEAVKKFPQNVNVCATVALATGLPEKIVVKIYADPRLKSNVHKIKVDCAAGSYEFVFRNTPSPANPKTSYLTALSIASSLENASH